MVTIEEFLKQRKSEGLLRELKPVSIRRGPAIYINGKEFVDFSSNDYLGLSSHPRLIEASKNALEKFGTSSSSSRLLSGSLEIHHHLEDKVALFKRKEAALVFNSAIRQT